VKISHLKIRQKNLILLIVSTALLLDNMLFMVIVPIITPILARGEEEKLEQSSSLGSSDFNFNLSAGDVFNSEYDSSQAWLP
jgi:hypothetical protein